MSGYPVLCVGLCGQLAPGRSSPRCGKDELSSSPRCGKDKLAVTRADHDVLGFLFAWYASSSCSRRPSVSAIRLQAIVLDRISAKHWRHFVKDFRLADETSAHCSRAELSALFVRCRDEHDDAKHPATRLAASPKHLSRTQFYAAIVRTAILKYVGLPLMTTDDH